MAQLRKWPRVAATFVLCALLCGCKHSTEEMKPGTETYSLKGTVVAVDGDRGEVTLAHDAIPGFMGAMTMPYKLTYGNETSELHRGDVIRARLVVEKTPDGDYRNARLDQLAVLGQARPSFKPESNYHVPTPGDAVPDFHFTDQDGKPIRMTGYQGKALLVTFIYTRCPLGDFCPKMSRNFASIDDSLRKDPAVYKDTKLLSLSFDPAFDTPSTLRAYGESYTEGRGFGHWQFAAPTQASLPTVEHFFNLGATGSGASITHSLSTVLIAPDGKIAAWYPGNDWSPGDVARKMTELVQAAPRTSSAGVPVKNGSDVKEGGHG